MALKTTLTQPTASGTGTVIATPGMPGAANPVRIVGRNASGAPTTGTFQVGDVVVNTDGTEYVCSVAGTPGTWVQIAALSYGTPSNIDASLTSLSAGSLTTVARADHVHTVSKVAAFIASYTSTGAASDYQVTFSNIPQTYNTLLVAANLGINGTAVDSVGIRINSDSGSNYIFGSSLGTQFTFTTANARNQPQIASSDSNLTSANVAIFPAYSGSAKKSALGYYSFNNGTTVNTTTGLSTGMWNSTAAITSLTFSSQYGGVSSQYWLSGSKIIIYGLP